ncbi:hypothetical protein ACQR3P_20450 [Rhodococcus sp. IEGM1300]
MGTKSAYAALLLVFCLPVQASGYGDVQFQNATKTSTINIFMEGENKAKSLRPGELYTQVPYPVAGGTIKVNAGPAAVNSITFSDSDACRTVYAALCFRLFSNDR